VPDHRQDPGGPAAGRPAGRGRAAGPGQSLGAPPRRHLRAHGPAVHQSFSGKGVSGPMITLDKIYHAAFVLKEVARRTDLIHATNLMKDVELYLKTENLQVTGSFKLRGAYYKISQLTEEQKKAGIIACSAGNHAQGVALAATRQGARSVVYMPDSAPISKV